MSLLKIAWRSMRQRALSSVLTGVSMALGVALVIAVLVLHSVMREQFSQGAQGYHLIVGAKGGSLQLTLNTVYHLSQPIENIPYSFYKDFITETDAEGNVTHQGQWAGYTKAAIPYCLGDSYPAGGRTFRVVGTTPGLFSEIEYGRERDGTVKRYTFRAGRNFKTENFYEAVIGSVVADVAGLGVGDTFHPTHNIVEEDSPEAEKHRDFKIVGVLDPTGTPNDRAMFINMEGFYKLEKHAKDEAAVAHLGPNEPVPEAQREVTAILVDLQMDIYSDSIRRSINKGPLAQAVYPSQEITRLFEGIVGPIQLLLLALTVLIVIVAGIGVMVSIYNSMSDRQHEIAVMRALGAGRGTVMSIILLESILLSLLGGMGGVVLGHGMMGVLNPYVVRQTGVTIHFLNFETMELLLLPGLFALASLVGLFPALVAYRTDVAKALSAHP